MSGCVQPKREKVPVQILDRELLAKAKVYKQIQWALSMNLYMRKNSGFMQIAY